MLRTDVVATARAMAAEGLVKGSEGNVSAREGDRPTCAWPSTPSQERVSWLSERPVPWAKATLC